MESLTVRAAAAAASAFILGVSALPLFIYAARRRGLGEVVTKGDSDKLDALHNNKAHTPTMGGAVVVGATAIAVLLFGRANFLVVLIGLVTLALAALGMVDDYSKLFTRGKGLRASRKLCLQVVIALVAATALFVHNRGSLAAVSAQQHDQLAPYSHSLLPPQTTRVDELQPILVVPVAPAQDMAEATAIVVPGLRGVHLSLGWGYIIFGAFVLVASCNAVNLTDGLDGLASGVSVFILLTYGAIAYASGRFDYAAHLNIAHVAGAGELMVVAAALVGALLAFLWFNAHPAQLFMGDTGSLALGGAIGCLALMVRQELLLVVVGGVLVAEAASVVLQVASFRLTGRRLFRIAPLHHHFQFGGQFETKVTTRMWIVGALLMVLALALLRVQ